jgi:hypothetical protein
MSNQFINDRLSTRSKVKSFTFIQPSKNNRELLQDLMIVMQSRKDLDLIKSIPEFKFEFGIVPTSLFGIGCKVYNASKSRHF